MKYDFSGWATRNDILCTDGRTIRKDAFKDCDGKVVPLVWNHQHDDPEDILGHALLENREDGVYTYGSFNDSQKAQVAKMAVEHGDVDSLSIYANRLKQNGGDVLHGDIKEVSLVLAGANSGAHIVDVIRHGEIAEDEFVIFSGEQIDIEHGEKEEKKEEVEHADEKKNEKDETVGEVFDSLSPIQKKVVYALIAQALREGGEPEEGENEEDETAQHADDKEEDTEEDGETVGDVIDSLTEKQKNVVFALIGQALESAKTAKHSDDSEEDSEEDEEPETEVEETEESVEEAEAEEAAEEEINHFDNIEGGNNMNVFEQNATGTEITEVLSHAEQVSIINDAKKNSNLRDAILAHGITNIGNAYPEPKAVPETPEFVMRDQGWVADVMKNVHHTPFSRIKSIVGNLTADEARANGYFTKGTEKIEEVFPILGRETAPTTVYKLQKMDRDDIDDITDFDVVAWLKQEMEVMLREECARAYLIGDGRGAAASNKIKEDKIRPIWTDDEVFAIHETFTVAANATDDDIAKALVKAAVEGNEDYNGSGNTVLYIAPDRLTKLLLLEDGFGHRLYKTKDELASAMLVDRVVAVPPMKNKTRTVTENNASVTKTLAGIIVDLRDYNVGMDKRGQTNWFEDFNIDFNKQEYLIETRQSGALVKPKSAIVLEYTVSGN